MNRKVFITIITLMISGIASAQTYYYRLTKKVHQGTTMTNTCGGQFITFISDICYESDKKGIGVEHGTLERSKTFSNSQFKVYMGKSYWGNDATFKFTSDLTTLKVVTESGDVYLYKRATPPANATTCSLIRKPASSSSGSSGGGGYPVQPTYPVGGGYNTGSGSTGGGTVSGGSGSSGSTVHLCRLCGGTGRKISQVHPGNSTQTKWCGECNKNVHTGHFHTKCDLCGGSGWIK